MYIHEMDKDFLPNALKKVLSKTSEMDTINQLLQLRVFHHIANKSATGHRDLVLRDYLFGIIQNNLASYREPAQIPSIFIRTSQQNLRTIFSQDIQTGIPEIKLWSVLYHIFVADPKLTQADLAECVPCDPKTITNWQKDAINLLVEYLREQEFQMSKQVPQSKKRNIPVFRDINLASLIDINFHVQSIAGIIGGNTPHSRKIVSLEGLGGMGKTSIAFAVAHHFAETDSQFEDIFWLQIRQVNVNLDGIEDTVDDLRYTEELLMRLCEQLDLPTTGTFQDLQERVLTRCQYHTYLIIIDNLETIQDISNLVPFVQQIGELGSSIILTSRISLDEYNYVYCYPVTELSADSAHKLLKQLRPNQALSRDFTEHIYHVVGGIPLVLRLVAGLGRFLDEDNIIKQIDILPEQADFNAAKTKNDPELLHKVVFEHIYWSLWDKLSPIERRLLLGMGRYLPPEGDIIDEIYDIADDTDISSEEATYALRKLIEVYLVNVVKIATMYHYRLHRLTYTYINAHIFEDDEL